MASKRVFVLLIGNKERGDVNHFQLLQEETALAEGRQLGFGVEVAYAPGFDQLRVLKRRLMDTASPIDAVVTEPASISTMDLVLRELKGKTGLMILSAWGPSVEQSAAAWGQGLPIGTVSTDHTAVGEIQGRQVKALLPNGGRMLYVAGPARSSAAEQRLAGLKSQLTDDVELHEISAGQWTEADGIVAFNDWYRVAKAGDPVLPVVAGGNDELALGARRACEALGDAEHRRALLEAKFLGVDGCPTFGEKLVAEGILSASIVTPANTGLALNHLARFWTEGTPVPLRSFTEARPLPAGSA
ncbi:MAG: substrate-binding domain-containing protein [Acidobacteriota bacterium]|jgi:ribose transport system substrate-binding protein